MTHIVNRMVVLHWNWCRNCGVVVDCLEYCMTHVRLWLAVGRCTARTRTAHTTQRGTYWWSWSCVIFVTGYCLIIERHVKRHNIKNLNRKIFSSQKLSQITKRFDMTAKKYFTQISSNIIFDLKLWKLWKLDIKNSK